MVSDAEIGAVLAGKFVIEGVLGRGGMGVVYAARHLELDQRVAIKCLLPHAMSNPNLVERFAREARAAAKIQGEHVARVIDVGRFEDGTPYMVMEYLQGRDLASELEGQGPLAVRDVVHYLLETCEALAQAHALQIVHRDLKPANLFLAQLPGRRPIVKVLDFGISKVNDPTLGALTRTASVMGTPYYMSPEQLLSSKHVDHRSDIWSLGIILYELLTGLPPFTGETPPEVVAKIMQNTPGPLASVRTDVPPGLEAVIHRCTRTNPAERYANVAELGFALVPFADDADREIAAATARVLGILESSLEGAAAAGPGRRDAAGVVHLGAHPAPDATRGVSGPGPAQASGAESVGTSPAMPISSQSVPGVLRRRPHRGLGLGVGLGVVAGAVGVVVLFRGNLSPRPSSPAAFGVVATPSPPPPVESVAPVGVAPVVAASAVPVAPPAAPPAALVVAVPSAPPRRHVAAAPPQASARPAPATSSSAAPPPPAPPPPAPPSPPANPLDLPFRP
jgi:serine/threonine-protein kinase